MKPRCFATLSSLTWLYRLHLLGAGPFHNRPSTIGSRRAGQWGNPHIDTDVLIVGAGPGRALSGERMRPSRPAMAAGRDPLDQSEHSKALAIFPRTLEIFDMAGVVRPFLEAANRVTSVAVVAHGRRLAHMRFAPEESPYRFIAMVPQDVTERLLVGTAAAQRRRRRIRTPRFVSAVEHDGRRERHAGPARATRHQSSRRRSSSAAMARTAPFAIS